FLVEGQRPAAGEILHPGGRLGEEAPGLVRHGDHADAPDHAARPEELHAALETAVLERRFEPVRVARHADAEAIALEQHVRRARALRPVDQVGDQRAVLALELEPEWQVAAGDRHHGSISAERRGSLPGSATGRQAGDTEREWQQHARRHPDRAHGGQSTDTGRGKPSAPARQGSHASAMRPTAMSDLRGAMRTRSSVIAARSRRDVNAPASCSMPRRNSACSALTASRLSPARATSPRSPNTRPAERAAVPARVTEALRPPKMAPSTEAPIEIAVSSLRCEYWVCSRATRC